MRHLILALAILTGLTTGTLQAATNKNLPGWIATSGNDRPVVQSASDSLIGVGDTGFVVCGIGATYCGTNIFNSARNPLAGTNLAFPSAVVSANPDSIVCNFMAIRKDADTSDGSAGIYVNLGTDASPLWSLYGSTAGADTSFSTLTKYTAALPFVVGRRFRPWMTVTTSTDTVRQRFVDCAAK